MEHAHDADSQQRPDGQEMTSEDWNNSGARALAMLVSTRRQIHSPNSQSASART